MAYHLHLGSVPLILSIPHSGTEVPDNLRARLTERAARLPDTDWHVDRLYGFAKDLGASVICARASRIVIDLNRDPDGIPLYPGQSNTELCPTTLFDGTPIYRDGCVPSQEEIEERKTTTYWPYHQALRSELDRLRQEHGVAILYDAHSIRSVVPRFFGGSLPDLNIGTGGGQTADPALVRRIVEACAADPTRSSVLDGRFKGGYITRHYGRPQTGIHAIQMELTQKNYMSEDDTFAYQPDRASSLEPTLIRIFQSLLAYVKHVG